MPPPKAAIRDALLATLERTLEAMVHAAAQTREGAIHEENRSEGAKDMRATEQSYVARGQAMRAEDLANEIQRLREVPVHDLDPGARIVAGALVTVRIESDEPRLYFVAPAGGGTELVVDGVRVTVVAPISGLGRALLGLREGDVFEHPVRGAQREWVIEGVA